MLYGRELAEAIEAMGLNKRQFAGKCVRQNGKPLTAQAIGDLISKAKIEPEPQTIWAVENALKKHCRCCGQYTEKEDAWNNSTTDRGKGSRKR